MSFLLRRSIPRLPAPDQPPPFCDLCAVLKIRKRCGLRPIRLAPPVGRSAYRARPSRFLAPQDGTARRCRPRGLARAAGSRAVRPLRPCAVLPARQTPPSFLHALARPALGLPEPNSRAELPIEGSGRSVSMRAIAVSAECALGPPGKALAHRLWRRVFPGRLRYISGACLLGGQCAAGGSGGFPSCCVGRLPAGGSLPLGIRQPDSFQEFNGNQLLLFSAVCVFYRIG